MTKRRGRNRPRKSAAPPPVAPSEATSPVEPTDIALPGEAMLHHGDLLRPAPWETPPDPESDLGQAPRGFDRHGRRTGAPTADLSFPDEWKAAPPALEPDQVELRADGEVIATVKVEPPSEAEGDPLPGLLPSRLLKWMDRSTQGPIGDLQNALVNAKWSLAPPGDPMTPNGSERWRAFPPGAFDAGWPYVPLPDRIDNDRQMRNLVAALRKVGTFDWEDR